MTDGADLSVARVCLAAQKQEREDVTDTTEGILAFWTKLKEKHWREAERGRMVRKTRKQHTLRVPALRLTTVTINTDQAST